MTFPFISAYFKGCCVCAVLAMDHGGRNWWTWAEIVHLIFMNSNYMAFLVKCYSLSLSFLLLSTICAQHTCQLEVRLSDWLTHVFLDTSYIIEAAPFHKPNPGYRFSDYNAHVLRQHASFEFCLWIGKNSRGHWLLPV